jgi:hypothetical protein
MGLRTPPFPRLDCAGSAWRPFHPDRTSIERKFGNCTSFGLVSSVAKVGALQPQFVIHALQDNPQVGRNVLAQKGHRRQELVEVPCMGRAGI